MTRAAAARIPISRATLAICASRDAQHGARIGNSGGEVRSRAARPCEGPTRARLRREGHRSRAEAWRVQLRLRRSDWPSARAPMSSRSCGMRVGEAAANNALAALEDAYGSSEARVHRIRMHGAPRAAPAVEFANSKHGWGSDAAIHGVAGAVRRHPAFVGRSRLSRRACPKTRSSTSCCRIASRTAIAANDRGGLAGDRLTTGFDPAHKGFYHGGDLKGLTARLDYIQGLGATAIWLGPIYKNKPVQGGPGRRRAGYHGYWITDFTRVDPHFGTDADMRAFVDAAHARGMKVYLDIITNHTADVIQYRECPDTRLRRIARARTIRTRARAGSQGQPINAGFRRRRRAHAQRTSRAHRSRLRLHAFRAAGRGQREGAGLAEFADLLPQPRQFRFLGRELAVRRLRRPRRSHDRESARGAGLHRHLRRLDRALRRRRLPHRYRAARESRNSGRPSCRPCSSVRAPAAFRTSTSSARWPPRAWTWRSSRGTRASTSCPRCSISDSPARSSKLLAGNAGTTVLARLYAGRRSVRRRRARGAAPADLHRQSRLRPLRLDLLRAARPNAQRRGSAAARDARATPCCSCCAACRWSTTATNRASSVMASTRPRARTCSRARWRATTIRPC